MSWTKDDIRAAARCYGQAATWALLAIMLFLAGCAGKETVYQPACPNMAAYSAENQKATADELRDAARKGLYPHLREKVTDGGNLRSQLRGAGCKDAGTPRPAIGRPEPAPSPPRASPAPGASEPTPRLTRP